MHLASPLLKKKFQSITDVVDVSTNDGDFAGVLVDLGGRIDRILDPNKKEYNVQHTIFMLDMHSDIVCTVKGLRSNDGHKGAVDLKKMVT